MFRTENGVRDLVANAVLAIEVEFSSWYVKKAGVSLGFTVKKEDAESLRNWHEVYGVPIVVCQVFLDELHVASLEEVLGVKPRKNRTTGKETHFYKVSDVTRLADINDVLMDAKPVINKRGKLVCRGYPSVTRLREAKEARHVPPDVKYVVLYFGDFDPSGEDIFRWINEELKPYNIVVRKAALTREQVRKYRLPPMIPKKSDPRYGKYVKKYGEVAVELDALHPATLRDIVRKAILRYMDVYKRLEVEIAEGIELEA